MNSKNFKDLHHKVFFGFSNRAEREALNRWIHLLQEDIQRDWKKPRPNFVCVEAKIDAQDRCGYVEALFTNHNTWMVKAYVAPANFFTTAVYYRGPYVGEEWCVFKSREDIDTFNIDNTIQNPHDWYMAALLCLAANGQQICKKCHDAYAICVHRKQDEAALLEMATP